MTRPELIKELEYLSDQRGILPSIILYHLINSLLSYFKEQQEKEIAKKKIDFRQ